jgi:hypothetical protein
LESGQEHNTFHFFIAIRPAHGPSQPPIRYVRNTLSPDVKQRGVKFTTPPTNAEVKNGRSIPPLHIHLLLVELN